MFEREVVYVCLGERQCVFERVCVRESLKERESVRVYIDVYIVMHSVPTASMMLVIAEKV